MGQLLEDLFWGELDPNGQCSIENAQYRKAQLTREENEQKLSLLLNDEESRMLIELVDADDEIIGITTVEYFVKGFRLGAKMMAEIYAQND